MKSAALDLGRYGITVNAVIPGLINTALTRHEDRYAQMICTGGNEPTGDVDKDEQTTATAAARDSLPIRQWFLRCACTIIPDLSVDRGWQRHQGRKSRHVNRHTRSKHMRS